MQFKLTPFGHQLEEWREHATDEGRAIFWEMGCGKSKLTLDTAGTLYTRGEIDALLVVAPNGVHRNWVTDEAPTHLSDAVGQPALFAYEAGKAGTKAHQQALRLLLSYDGFALLAISYDAFMTKKGKAYAKRFLTQRKCLYVLDESDACKNPKAQRTKSILASAQYAPYRRILTGTPNPQGPFDLFSQIKFLVPGFWRSHQLGTFTEFKRHFGVMGKVWNPNVTRTFDPQCKRWVECEGAFVDVVKGYQRVPELREMLRPLVSRVTKDDVLDLPPKLYSRRTFAMGKEQARLYAEMEDEAIAWLNSGEPVTAPLALTQLLRLQQIACGYLPTEFGDDPVERIEDCKRAQLLGDIVEEQTHGCIVWARFTYDIDLVLDELRKRGVSAVRYDGQTSSDDRERAKQDFQAGRVRVFVGNPAAGATGLTLTAAKTVIYYSNSFSLRDRLQSEDRAHRIGQDNAVLYVDIEAEGTVDEKITRALRDKADIAAELNGDRLKELL